MTASLQRLRRISWRTGCGIAAVSVVSSMPAHADRTLRCGSVLVNVGMVAPEVEAKCGMPQDRSVSDIPVRARLPNGASAVTGTLHVERWTYDRGYGQFPALLTFEDGKLKSIELLTKP